MMSHILVVFQLVFLQHNHASWTVYTLKHTFHHWLAHIHTHTHSYSKMCALPGVGNRWSGWMTLWLCKQFKHAFTSMFHEAARLWQTFQRKTKLAWPDLKHQECCCSLELTHEWNMCRDLSPLFVMILISTSLLSVPFSEVSAGGNVTEHVADVIKPMMRECLGFLEMLAVYYGQGTLSNVSREVLVYHRILQMGPHYRKAAACVACVFNTVIVKQTLDFMHKLLHTLTPKLNFFPLRFTHRSVPSL